MGEGLVGVIVALGLRGQSELRFVRVVSSMTTMMMMIATTATTTTTTTALTLSGQIDV